MTIFGNDGHGVFTLSESYGFGGVGVRVADLNSDSWPDLVVLDGRNDEGRSDNAADILLNDGTGRFTRSSTLIVGAYSDGFRIQDFDQDGLLDIAFVTRANLVLLFSGDGQGNFLQTKSFATGVSRSFSLATADFDGDGDFDLAVVGNTPSGVAAVLLNDGEGNFALSGGYDTQGVYAGGAEAADVDGDGQPDLVAANWGSGTVAVLLGNGAGGFSSTRIYSIGGSGPDSVILADFEGDGRCDIAVGNDLSSNVSVLLFRPPHLHELTTYEGTNGVPLDGSRSSDPNQPSDTLTYEWDLDGDGFFETAGMTPTFSTAALNGPATRTVTLLVTDDLGLTSTDTATIHVRNVAPTITDLSIDSTLINVGGTITLNGTFTDPSPSDTHQVRIQWGDGSDDVIPPDARGQILHCGSPVRQRRARRSSARLRVD